MTTFTDEPNSDDTFAAEGAGQATTGEGGMDADTNEEGVANESSYSPTTATPVGIRESQPEPNSLTSHGASTEIPLARMNDQPESPDKGKSPSDEVADHVTVLAKMNDNAPHEGAE